MPQSDRNSQRDNKQRGNEPSFNWRGVILIAVAFGFFALAMLFWRGNYPQLEDVPYNRFLELLENKQIVNDKNAPLTLFVEEGQPTQQLRGKYIKQGTGGAQNMELPFRTVVYLNFTSNLQDKLAAAGIQPAIRSESHPFGQALLSFGPVLFLLALLYFLFRQQIRMAGKGALNFGKSKARMLARDKNKITFKDVAGVEEAKDEVQELVEFLRDPKKFQKLGGRIPKGVLLVGPPGTGKTLLARAIAGEANVPFFTISGSDFVEMFVGVGASRVRDMLEQAKKNAPCIIFIDEIDAVGRHRGAGLAGGNDEREQTLNQLLVEMDGFEMKDNIILIAATNRPDILDPALLRPGRFDRQIVVDRPDRVGRRAILAVHTKGKPLAPEIDLDTLASGTPGFTGADLANLVNEAALLAARRGKKIIEQDELEEGIMRRIAGPEKKARLLSEHERKITAYHEMGHALVGHFLEHTDPVHKITIVSRGQALGLTISLPPEDRYLTTRAALMEQIAATLGGRAAEELVFHEVTTGAANDLEKITHTAKQMVMRLGMSEKLGPRVLGRNHDMPVLLREIGNEPEHSEEIAREIDDEIRRVIEESHELALAVLRAHMEELHRISEVLIERETIDRDQFERLIAGEDESTVFPEPEAAPETPAPAEEPNRERQPRRPRPFPPPGAT